ncbi:TRAP transporter small permease [Venatoribacter cucullus]|uniref:TRAP transporter small permease protein n=1 Tax=Venatoribacter cucullus TaxID=2661630 RepID=A0A9E8FIN7_9GAMM|nr:TRAP transporter small permease [Venatoribacter cucullus]QQD23178.1 TRAP transporter small permease subunit [Venatoribacter cucullus]UZK02612.1 TRAP transporter small permease subunit [Venatoribacter cucullus]
MTAFFRILHRAEDGLLVLLLLAMIVLAGADILARSLFGGGLVWIPPLLRVMVLWLGLLGALLATRTREHIAIDLASRLAGPGLRRLLALISSVFAAMVCLLLAWHSQNFVRFAWEFGDVAFGRVPAWPLQIIIPLSFALMGLRFMLQGVQDLLAKTEGEAR